VPRLPLGEGEAEARRAVAAPSRAAYARR
jgi:hypothetical protein